MMNKYFTVLKNEISKGKPFKLSVVGTSMLPFLHEGDTVEISKDTNYNIGDIIAFLYQNNEFLVHRILKIHKNIVICKGDNSFRIESITKEQIFGKVTACNNVLIEHPPQKMCQLSFSVGIEFKRLNYDVERVKSSDIYAEYTSYILEVWEKNNAQ